MIKYIDKDIFDSIWRLKLGAKIERDYGDHGVGSTDHFLR